jgi:hypothetical protein
MCAATQEGLSETWNARPRRGIGQGAATALERHYRPDELAVNWGLSVKVIREIFLERARSFEGRSPGDTQQTRILHNANS